MKKLVSHILGLSLVLALSTGLSYAASSGDSDKKVDWKELHGAAGEARATHIAAAKKAQVAAADLQIQLEEVKEIQLKSTQKADFHQRVSNSASLFGPIYDLCQELQADSGNCIKKLAGLKAENESDVPHASELAKGASLLLNYLQMFDIEVTAPSGKGSYSVAPFSEKPSVLKIGNHIFIPGIAASAFNRAVDISHERDGETSFWLLSNGISSGRSSIHDKVVVDGSHSVVTFPGTSRDPDGSTLILLPSASGVFSDLSKQGKESTQVNCGSVSAGYKVEYALSDVKSETLSITIPSGIVSGLSIIRDQVKNVTDPRQLAPVYDMICASVDKLRVDLTALHDKTGELIAKYDKL